MAIPGQACKFHGVLIVEHKQDGPTTCLVFLGIEVDTVKEQLCLPAEKLNRLQILLQEWEDMPEAQARIAYQIAQSCL